MVRHVVDEVKRKPWGMGRAAVQRYRRQTVALEVTELLLERLDEDKVTMTGQLFPRGNLKKPRCRTLFDWVHDPEFAGSRVFTKPMLKLVVRKLLKRLAIPLNPENTKFVGQQSARLRRLIRSAKRVKEGLGKTWKNISKYN